MLNITVATKANPKHVVNVVIGGNMADLATPIDQAVFLTERHLHKMPKLDLTNHISFSLRGRLTRPECCAHLLVRFSRPRCNEGVVDNGTSYTAMPLEQCW